MGLLRILFALSVVISHSSPIYGFSLINGALAVQAFFIVSGFYMALILNEKYVGKKYSYRLYITNRFMRIYPIYWLILISTFLFSLYSLHNAGKPNPLADYYLHSFSTLSGLQLIQNVSLDLVQNISIFLTFDVFKINPNASLTMLVDPAWTLEIELLFYLIAPFLVRRSSKIIVSIAMLSPLIRYVILHLDLTLGYPLTTRFFLGQLCFFLFGVLSYKAYVGLKKKHVPWFITWGIFLFFIAFTCIYNYLPPFQIRWSHPIDWLYYLVLMITIPLVFLRFKNSALDRNLGDLSYPVYITHLLVIIILINETKLIYTDPYFSIIVIICTVVLSIVITKYIEQPIDLYRQLRLKKFKLNKNKNVAKLPNR